jgi:hypothetical protein
MLPFILLENLALEGEVVEELQVLVLLVPLELQELLALLVPLVLLAILVPRDLKEILEMEEILAPRAFKEILEIQVLREKSFILPLYLMGAVQHQLM